MKSKKISKTLKLSKRTISDLNFRVMNRINGGGSDHRCTFPDCTETYPDFTACYCYVTENTCDGYTCDSPPCP